MNEANQNLKVVIDDFLVESVKVLKHANASPEAIGEDDLERISECIWKMNHFARELLAKGAEDESTQYNAEIIKNFTEEEIELDHTKNENISLIQAADHIKNEHRKDELMRVMQNWAREVALQGVVLDSLREISQELVA